MKILIYLTANIEKKQETCALFREFNVNLPKVFLERSTPYGEIYCICT